ncbi:hypothetical protein [uncultured Dokdonia sp.]|uniref:hypothetical protein n=1 Tax=uncultured Dokdonia sp. TaxID=575653 RepID=UPI00261893D4|nr:hypothetical protein [uncultured Dokdonia sp.]
MINYIAGISLLFLVSACGDKNTTNNVEGETWQLIEMTAGMVSPSDQEAELSMNQTYVFTPEMTFTKQQTKDASTIEASGTYTTKETSEGIFYSLKYTEGLQIVGSCTGNDNEELLLRKDGKLQNSWMMCDGPLLVYEKE